MHPEEYSHWGYAAFNRGQLISTGPNPVPFEILNQATEIRWIKLDPSTATLDPVNEPTLTPEPSPLPEESPIPPPE